MQKFVCMLPLNYEAAKLIWMKFGMNVDNRRDLGYFLFGRYTAGAELRAEASYLIIFITLNNLGWSRDRCRAKLVKKYEI